jgi:transmembrane sensor
MEDQFSNLVSKVLAGEASDEEKKSLQYMLLENNEQSLMYNQIKEYWDADVKLTSNRDNENFEKKLLSQLSFEPEVQNSKFRKLYVRFASAAAILFFVATCSLAYLYVASPRQLYTYSAQSASADYVLEDGTMVKLNKNSSITFKSDYGDSRRDVELKGEAFFKVTKDKSRPFSVETLGTKTEVLGTSFNVKSLPETGMVVTTLVTGSVKFTAKQCAVLLHPGEEIVYNTNSHEYKSRSIDLQYNTAWVSGRINYSGIRFGDLILKLEHIYNLKISVPDQRIANRIVSASILTEEPIEDVLAAFEKELGFKFTMDSTQITINRKN